MPLVKTLSTAAHTSKADAFVSRWGPVALVIRPDEVALRRITSEFSLPPTLFTDEGESQMKTLLLMLRQFRKLEVLFLPASFGRRVLGRSPSCDVVVTHSSVSKEHAAIHETPTGWQLEDLKSLNGTAVNGVPTGTTAVPLSDGDTIRIGHVNLIFVSSSTLHAQLLALS